MATKLKSGMVNVLSVSEILRSKGRVLTDGFMDEFDMEAERAATAIARARGMAPRKIGARKAGFGRPQHHTNADRHNLSYVG